ncbi:MAG TPA: site-2 protease family protein [Candidatus Acidoferrales bacterium]|nr:site-2 protease family protein [Candidatus Acidoferrales bacterium]
MDFNPHLLTVGFLWYLAFLFSTVCHEGAHALAGKLGGDPTAFEAGQVTLNPWPHIRREPLGLVAIPIVSYLLNGWMMGWASAPYDPNWQRNHPRRAAWMALAGPGANCTLMILAGLGIRAGMRAGAFTIPIQPTFSALVEAADPERLGFLATLASIFFTLNLILATFNLLPLPPLDGSSVITLFLPEQSALRLLDFYRTSGLGFAGILIAWYGYGYVFRWVGPRAVDLLFHGF